MLNSSNHSFENKRQMGVYYTPIGISKALSNWAITSATDKILEPSFGGCSFLQAAKERLNELGCNNINSNLYGCDIDGHAFSVLKSILGFGYTKNNFLNKDFLFIRPHEFAVDKFDVVIGNPPYVSIRGMSQYQVERSKDITRALGYTINSKAGIWAHFVIHSLNFLNEGGRCAWILPGSFLFADYAVELKSILQKKFSTIYIIEPNNLIFLDVGTDEKTVIVLCEDFKESTNGQIRYHYSTGNLDINNSIIQSQDLSTYTKGGVDYTTLANNPNTVELGQIVDIKIGIVTGANKNFILKKSEANKLLISSKYLKPILPKSQFCSGMSFDVFDITKLNNDDQKINLVDASKLKSGNLDAFNRFYNSIPQEVHDTNVTFKINKPWYNVDDNRIPDAFLIYMNQIGPSFIINEARVNTTNSIYRVYFKNILSHVETKKLALGFVSSFTQLSAEYEGRVYGSGVLKLEPSNAKKVKILLITLSDEDVNELYLRVNRLLKASQIEEARRLVDLSYEHCYPDLYNANVLALVLSQGS